MVEEVEVEVLFVRRRVGCWVRLVLGEAGAGGLGLVWLVSLLVAVLCCPPKPSDNSRQNREIFPRKKIL